MLSMLDQVIIDAKELREVALKSAESVLKEKYASEFEKLYLSHLNEEDSLDAASDEEESDTEDPSMEVPPDAQILHDDENMPEGDSLDEEPEAEFNLDDFGNKEEEPGKEKPTFVLDQLDFAYEDNDGQVVIDLGNFDLDDESLNMNQKLTGDATQDAQAQSSQEQEPQSGQKKELDKTKKAADKAEEKNQKDSDSDEDFLSTESIAQMMKDLLAEEDNKINMLEEKLEEKWVASFQLIKKNHQKKIAELESKISNFEAVLKESEETNSDLSMKLSEATLAGLKLSYKNKTLNDGSLNERQKRSICKAISGASDFEQAKSIFETLKESVSGGPRRGSSITDKISQSSNSPMFVKNQKDKEEETPLLSEGMRRIKVLAGIK